MSRKALVVIDLQNDITKNYREIIDPVNTAVDWAVGNEMDIAYIRHYKQGRLRKAHMEQNLSLS